jgi:hypothetical protein
VAARAATLLGEAPDYLGTDVEKEYRGNEREGEDDKWISKSDSRIRQFPSEKMRK